MDGDQSALLVLSNEIYIFETEQSAYDAAIKVSERHAAQVAQAQVAAPFDDDIDDDIDEEDAAAWTCPFVVKVTDVDPNEYKKMTESAKPSKELDEYNIHTNNNINIIGYNIDDCERI
jgi:hypothetical protein